MFKLTAKRHPSEEAKSGMYFSRVIPTHSPIETARQLQGFNPLGSHLSGAEPFLLSPFLTFHPPPPPPSPQSAAPSVHLASRKDKHVFFMVWIGDLNSSFLWVNGVIPIRRQPRTAGPSAAPTRRGRGSQVLFRGSGMGKTSQERVPSNCFGCSPVGSPLDLSALYLGQGLQLQRQGFNQNYNPRGSRQLASVSWVFKYRRSKMQGRNYVKEVSEGSRIV